MAEFKLSASLKGHDDDVRAVVFPSAETVISASRDATVRIWNRISSTPPTYDATIAVHGSAFINAVTYISPSSNYTNGLIVSGGKDTMIDVRQPGQPSDSDAERLLLGHQGNVCALDACRDGGDGYLVSGSWDASAMVWNISKGESTATLEGHEGSVWAVLAYDRSTIITGCADQQIRIYRPDGKLVRRLRGSSDVIRALCKLPPSSSPAQFASAGNDGIIRQWTLDGTEVAQLHGHENFVYSLAALPTGELVSSSEDRTVRIWRDGTCIQTITHPAISVWTVAVHPDTGDIATGASDRIVRIFTRSPDRVADSATLAAFDDAVRGSSIPEQGLGDINKEKLPGSEFLTTKSGTKEGQVQLIREGNGNVSAHQWSTAANQWISVGTVVDAAGSSGRKQEYLGQDYDYVFDVDIAEGKPPLKLPYNLSQNPYEAAHKFIADNELPMDYLDQVANFVVQNTQGATIGQQSSESQQPQPAAGRDPWGQESRYRPGDANATSGPTTSTDAPTSQSQLSRSNVLPQREYLKITSANFSVILKKIIELNGQHVSSGRKDICLSPGELSALSAAVKALETALASDSRAAETADADMQALDAGLAIAIHIATIWPPKDRIPGLDLYRLFAAVSPSVVPSSPSPSTSPASSPSQHQKQQQYRRENKDPLTILTTSFALPSHSPDTSSTSSSTTGANPNPNANANATMLSLRLLANLFSHPAGRAYVLQNFTPRIHAAVRSSVAQFASNRNVLIAAMTLYINIAVAIATHDAPTATTRDTTTDATAATAAAISKQLFEDLLALLADPTPTVADSEVVYRALVALGTLLCSSGFTATATEVKAQVKAVLQGLGTGAEARIVGVVRECLELVR